MMLLETRELTHYRIADMLSLAMTTMFAAFY
jgi:hypothetical protein